MKKGNPLKIRIGKGTIYLHSMFKYLKLISKPHLESLATKASEVSTLLTKMLPNIIYI